MTGRTAVPPAHLVDAVVIGAGQAGLSASFHLRRLDVDHVVLDAGTAPGGAWQHRWPTLRMDAVNGVHDLPGTPLPATSPAASAAEVMSAYFAEHERRWDLPVLRPVRVVAVRSGTADDGGRLVVETDDGDRWAARAVLNATGTWSKPFRPYWPGLETFAGRQLHTAEYRGPADLAGASVAVVGGGISGVQLLVEVAEVARTTWVTRREPVFREGAFDAEAGRRAVALVDQRVRAGLPPGSVVSVTGIPWTPQLRQAAARGVLDRLPVPDRVVPDGLVWNATPDGHGGGHGGGHLAVDVLLWCTGFRAALDHLAPLRLREPGGGIRVEGTVAAREPRLHLLGYGPSASTIGANRAGWDAARAVRARLLEPAGAVARPSAGSVAESG